MKLDLDYLKEIRTSLKEIVARCNNRVSLKDLFDDDDDKPIKEVIYVSYY